MKEEYYQVTLNAPHYILGNCKTRPIDKNEHSKKEDIELILVDLDKIFRSGK
jgi:hypothetical protein